MLIANLGCDRSPAEPDRSHGDATGEQTVSEAPGRSDAPVQVDLQVEPVPSQETSALDSRKGHQALAAYRLLADPHQQPVAALASGSFIEPGADEVLLLVESGADRAAGEYLVVVMRREDGKWRRAKDSLQGNGFSVPLRVDTAAKLDVLVICEEQGQQGVYSSFCGFFDETGMVRAVGTADARLAHECGSDTAAVLHEVSTTGTSLRFIMEVVDFELVKQPGDPEGRCSKEVVERKSRHTIVYALESGRPVPSGSRPAELAEALQRSKAYAGP